MNDELVFDYAQVGTDATWDSPCLDMLAEGPMSFQGGPWDGKTCPDLGDDKTRFMVFLREPYLSGVDTRAFMHHYYRVGSVWVWRSRDVYEMVGSNKPKEELGRIVKIDGVPS